MKTSNLYKLSVLVIVSEIIPPAWLLTTQSPRGNRGYIISLCTICSHCTQTYFPFRTHSSDSQVTESLEVFKVSAWYPPVPKRKDPKWPQVNLKRNVKLSIDCYWMDMDHHWQRCHNMAGIGISITTGLPVRRCVLGDCVLRVNEREKAAMLDTLFSNWFITGYIF